MTKKRLPTNACSACHKRKIKCDYSTRRPCTNCRVVGTICQLHVDERRKRKCGEDIDDHFGDELKRMAPVARLKYLLADGAPFGMDYVKHLIKTKDVKTSKAQTFNKKSHERNMVYYFPSSSHFQMYALTSDQIHSYVDPAYHIRDLSALQLPDSTATAWEIFSLEGAFLLPKKSICESLIKEFFEFNHWIFPFIDKKSFLKQYEERQCSVLLLQSILRCAIISSTDSRFFDENQTTHLASKMLTRRVKCLQHYKYEANPVARIQSCLLLTKGETLSGKEWDVEESIYEGAKLIHLFGFHRSNVDLDPFSQNEKKLCYWYWFIMCNAYMNGNVFDTDVDVDMLTLDDFPEELSYQDKYVFIKIVELSGILKNIRKVNYSAKMEFIPDTTETVVYFTNIINKWKSTLPAFFKECLESNKILQKEDSKLFVYVHLMYCKVVLYLHKKTWMYGSVTDKEFSNSGYVCVNTVNMVLDICDEIVASEYLKRRLHELFNRIIQEVFQIVNYKYSTDPDPSTRETCLSFVERLQTYFDATAVHSLTAKVSSKIAKTSCSSMQNGSLNNTPTHQDAHSFMDHFSFTS